MSNTFEELTTMLVQIEACLNSRPLGSLPCGDDGVDALTPGYFLIGCPLDALSDPFLSYQKFFSVTGTCVKLWCGILGRDSQSSESRLRISLLEMW